jgi:hypothetical protein
MIVQMTVSRNDLFLIKELLPIWKKYSDGFVFVDDRSTDGTYDFLMEYKDEFNILDVIRIEEGADGDDLWMESNLRQPLFDKVLEYSGNIICLDTDEYLDGFMSKEELESLLESNRDVLINLPWVQYTGENEIRVDGPWNIGANYKDRLGSYGNRAVYKEAQTHGEHLPNPGTVGMIDVPILFVSHLQWLDKRSVGIKQYFYKILDYVHHLKHNVEVIPASDYDASVRNFDWEYSTFNFPLKVSTNLFSKNTVNDDNRLSFIQNSIEKYDIPNLNDWNMGIHDGRNS